MVTSPTTEYGLKIGLYVPNLDDRGVVSTVIRLENMLILQQVVTQSTDKELRTCVFNSLLS